MFKTSIVLSERTKQTFFLHCTEAVMKWCPIIIAWINMPVSRFSKYRYLCHLLVWR